eukprot:scaffold204665_cov33-Tisochrysis_lutea.AAC.2
MEQSDSERAWMNTYHCRRAHHGGRCDTGPITPVGADGGKANAANRGCGSRQSPAALPGFAAFLGPCFNLDARPIAASEASSVALDELCASWAADDNASGGWSPLRGPRTAWRCDLLKIGPCTLGAHCPSARCYQYVLPADFHAPRKGAVDVAMDSRIFA